MIGVKILAVLVSTAFLATGARIARQKDETGVPLITCGPGPSSFSLYQEINATATIIRSHNYPGNYGNNEYCSIEFYAKDESMFLNVYFTNFSLVDSPDCSKGLFCIDGSIYCDKELDKQIISRSSSQQ